MEINLKKVSILLFIICFNLFNANSQSKKKFKITLDAGHGDHDAGANYHGLKEKNITLAIVLKTGKILEKHPDIEVIYTRKTDVFIELTQRAKIANKANADLFVSVHCNANKNLAASGTETYVMGMSRSNMNLEVSKTENSVIFLEDNYKQVYKGFDPNNPETLIGLKIIQENNLNNSINIASKIQENFIENGLKSRGVKQEPLWVLDATVMPGVLIETGFVSNVAEGQRLNSEDGQMNTANAIANAIIEYKKEFFDDGENIINETPTKNHVETPVKQKLEVVKHDTVVVKSDSSDTKNNKTKHDKNEVVFKVQISASPKKLELKSSNFKGLKNISSTFSDQIYRYTYGETSSYEEAKNLLKTAKDKGYQSAFIVAFKDGKSILMQDVIK